VTPPNNGCEDLDVYELYEGTFSDAYESRFVSPSNLNPGGIGPFFLTSAMSILGGGGRADAVEVVAACDMMGSLEYEYVNPRVQCFRMVDQLTVRQGLVCPVLELAALLERTPMVRSGEQERWSYSSWGWGRGQAKI
jgi:hypothetical protein